MNKADWRQNWHRSTLWKCGCYTELGYRERLYIAPCGDVNCEILEVVLEHNQKVAILAEKGIIQPEPICHLSEKP